MRKFLIILCFSSFLGRLSAQKNSVGFQALDVTYLSLYYERQFFQEDKWEISGRFVLPIHFDYTPFDIFSAPIAGLNATVYYGVKHKIEFGLGAFPTVGANNNDNSINPKLRFIGTSRLGYVYDRTESPWRFSMGVQLNHIFYKTSHMSVPHVSTWVYYFPYLGISYKF